MKYAIVSQQPQGNQTLFQVVLQSDDGYEEIQTYLGDVSTLVNATKNFNQQRVSKVVAPPVDMTKLTFVNVP